MSVMKSVNWVNLRQSLQESDIWAETWVVQSQSNEDWGKNIPDEEKVRAPLMQKELGCVWGIEHC